MYEFCKICNQAVHDSITWKKEPFCLTVARKKTAKYSLYQRWSPRGRPWPRGQILKSLALASKVKSLALASRPQVLENWPVLGSRTALSFELLKFCGVLEKFFGKRIFVEIAWKIFVKTFFFFWRALALVSLALASSIPVLGLESVCPRKGCPWPWIFLCPWPRALCSRLHLWLLHVTASTTF